MKLLRDANIYKNFIKERSDGSCIVTEDASIHIPLRWLDVELSIISKEISTYALIPIIINNKTYSVLNACTVIKLANPASLSIITVNDESYYELKYDKNTVIFPSLVCVRDAKLIFRVMDELMFKAKVPWWVSVDDLCTIFKTATEYSGSAIGEMPEVIEFMVSVISRVKNDRISYLRQNYTTKKDYELSNVEYVPFTNNDLSVSSTTGKLSGAYFDVGVTSALINQSTEVSKMEKVLRA